MVTRKIGKEPPQLRVDAESQLAHTPPAASLPGRSAEELLHELQVHRIELEMQNETLRQAQFSLEESRDRYVNLYEFAPVSYLALTREGMIFEANLTSAALLGVERKKLLRRNFSRFVMPEDSERWRRHFTSMARHGAIHRCELALKRDDGSILHVWLDSLCMESGGESPLVRVTLVDVSERWRAEAALQSSRADLLEAQNISRMGRWELDLANNRLYWSDGIYRIFEIDPTEFGASYEAFLGLIHPEDRDGVDRAYTESLKNKQPYEISHRLLMKDGRIKWVNEIGRTDYGQQGQALRSVGIVQDITEHKRAEEELRIAAIAFESQAGMVVTDPHGVIVRVNRAFTRLTGYSAEEAVGKTPTLLKSGRHDHAFYLDMWKALKQEGYWQGQMWNRRKNGKIYAEWLTITAVAAPDGRVTHYVGTFSDITQNIEAEAEVHRLAYYDPLTQLPNRRLLQDRLGQALAATVRNGHCGAILFMDLDNFKTLNDTRGHDIGDLLLVEVAQRLHACVRGGDTVARLGGDEFVLLLEDLSGEAEEAAAQAKSVGGKAQEAIARSYRLKGYEYHCTTSIGIGLFRDGNATVEELLKHADLAMYQSKKAGRDTLRFFDPAMQVALDERSALEADMRQAMKHRQLRLYYQPQIESARGLVGAEALLRWVHPERGLVAPGEFIPLAEETGLILPIGLWVLETACAQLRAWASDPHSRDLRLAVNVSARQFRQPDFVAQVQQVLAQSGADPARLKIELTESLVIDNVSNTITKMQELKAIGVGFSMDDFGTGYSSLSYLTRLPLDQLKIDQSFIRDIGSDPSGAAIVQTIITMGQTLGLNVIAEGVENEAQRDFLACNGCHTFQGYFFSRPVPLAEFEQFANLNRG